MTPSSCFCGCGVAVLRFKNDSLGKLNAKLTTMFFTRDAMTHIPAHAVHRIPHNVHNTTTL
jgi:hypothetical protein